MRCITPRTFRYVPNAAWREEPDLVPLELQYGDYAVWQQDTLQGERFEQCLTYWRDQLRPPIPILKLPYDRPRPSVQSFQWRLPDNGGT